MRKSWLNHLVAANLKGLDSHGVLRIPQYVGNIRRSEIVPGAGIETVRETAATALLDLNWNFGQVGARTAAEMAVAKAGRQGLGSVALYRTQHVGCLSLYTEAVARRREWSGLRPAAAASPSGHWVAPWGGREGRIGTNPVSLAAPTTGRPILFDAATSAISEGKVRLSRDSGKSLPDTWLVDAAGRPSDDPNALYGSPGGAILPVGGTLAYKGFGFAMIAQILSTVLTGATAERMGGESNNFWILAIDIAAFTSPLAFRKGARRVRRLRKISSPCRRVRAGSDARRARLRNRETPRSRGDSDRRRGLVADRSRRRGARCGDLSETPGGAGCQVAAPWARRDLLQPPASYSGFARAYSPG